MIVSCQSLQRLQDSCQGDLAVWWDFPPGLHSCLQLACGSFQQSVLFAVESFYNLADEGKLNTIRLMRKLYLVAFDVILHRVLLQLLVSKACTIPC